MPVSVTVKSADVYHYEPCLSVSSPQPETRSLRSARAARAITWTHASTSSLSRSLGLYPSAPSLWNLTFQCVCWLFIFKDTEPSPLQDALSVRQQGGLPAPPPVVPDPESIDAQAAYRGRHSPIASHGL